MTMKLIQKSFFNGTREFEIAGDIVHVRIKQLFKEERLTVGLSTLNPEPIVNAPYLDFHGRNSSGALLSLWLNEPNIEEFNAFVDTLKHRASADETQSVQDEKDSPDSMRTKALARNVYEEPPEFDKSEPVEFKPIIAQRLATDITMLKTYLDEADIKPLLDAMEVLLAEPDNEAAFGELMTVFNELGITQGAVLTYAPYLKVLLSSSVWS